MTTIPESPPARPRHSAARNWTAPTLLYMGLLLLFWLTAKMFRVEARLGGHMPSGFASFALLLAPFWAFGFGAADALHHLLSSRAARVLAPALLLLPYLVFALPRGEFRLPYAIALLVIPIAQAGILELFPPGGIRGADAGMSWQDVVALALVGIPVEFRLLGGAWPGFSAMPKLLLVDATLYSFLVVRRLPGVGYDFRPRLRDLASGMREWLFFAPLAIGIGLALRFIAFRPHAANPRAVAAAWLITFFFVAIPEELFFRGLLQNLLERRFTENAGSDAPKQRTARLRALVITSVIFGLSHFNKPLPFNWRYVLLASIAGIFYGRAWLDRRRLFSSAITHSSVDVIWGVWFRL